MIATDLDSFSASTEIEVSGVIGFPTLRQEVLTINYCDGLIYFGR